MPGEPGVAGETGYTGHRVTDSIIIVIQKLQHLHATSASGQFLAIYAQSSSHTPLKGQFTPTKQSSSL